MLRRAACLKERVGILFLGRNQPEMWLTTFLCEEARPEVLGNLLVLSCTS